MESPRFFFLPHLDQANVAKTPLNRMVKLKGFVFVCRRLLASPRLGTKGMDLLKMSSTSFGYLVNRAEFLKISKNMPRVSWIDWNRSVRDTNFANRWYYRYHDHASCSMHRCMCCMSVIRWAQCFHIGLEVLQAEKYSLLHLECHFFSLKSQSLI